MKITRIRAENLFSWNTLDIDFDSECSIISFIGRNGSGKSSIFEIIKWVLFKKSTKKNVKGDYGKKNGWGQIYFDNGLHFSRSTKEPKTINAPDDQVIDQEGLNNILGCNYESFMAALMCDQERVSSFVNEKTDTGKARIFGEMLGCGILDRMRNKVSKIKNNDQVEYESAISRVNTLKEQLEVSQIKFGDKSPSEYKDSIAKLKIKLKSLEDEYQKCQDNYNQQLDLYNKWVKYEAQESMIKSVSDSKRKTKKRMLELKREISKLNDEAAEQGQLEILLNWDKYGREYGEKINNINVEINKAHSAMQVEKYKYDNVKKLMKQGGACPTCGTEISGGTKERLTKNLKSASNKFHKYKDMVKKLNDEKYEITELYDDVSNKKNAMDSVKSEYNNLKKYLASGIDENEQKLNKPTEPKPNLDELNSEINKRSETTFKYRAEIRARIDTYNNFVKVRRALTEAKKGVKELEVSYYISRWLFNNLPMIKLMYISENKERLQNLINENLVSISLPFQVEIDTQKELKSKKEIKDEFSFRIKSLDGNKAENSDLSGGEKTLLLLAVQFAINDLISPNLDMEIYDEIYGSLDDKNIDTIIPMIQERGKRKQIFTISHKKEISSAFDGEIEVRKDSSGSHYYRR